MHCLVRTAVMVGMWNRIVLLLLKWLLKVWLWCGGLSGAESTVSRIESRSVYRTATFARSFLSLIYIQTKGLLRSIGRHFGSDAGVQ